MADLEGGADAIATASGMGAINTVLLALLRSGDQVIAQQSLYGGTFAMLADNTFATPLLCRPVEYGADVVIHEPVTGADRVTGAASATR
ncbi:cystathionine beta-lyase/cystathionine gamma-synthase [Kitasatospora sp. MAA19]|nr:cystathionine beta-lyase/cystathionine gamma-synthase [Kitasatospora sp. MAA19]